MQRSHHVLPTQAELVPLTYMATLAKLVEDGALFKIEADLDPGVQPVRFLYGTPSFGRFLRDVLPTLESCWHIEQGFPRCPR